ncbi:MAG: hypothetical protein ACR2NM_10390, partial [Bythopirellula sp.]
MRQDVQAIRGGPWRWCAAIVGLSALVGAWNAQDPSAAKRSTEQQLQATTVADKTPSKLEKIESTLAQAGCPGWLVLASEGEAALEPPPHHSSAGVIEQTSLQVTTNGPLFDDPVPARVASRGQLAPPASAGAQLTTGSKDDPNDLLDGVPDLLAPPPPGEAGL